MSYKLFTIITILLKLYLFPNPPMMIKTMVQILAAKEICKRFVIWSNKHDLESTYILFITACEYLLL